MPLMMSPRTQAMAGGGAGGPMGGMPQDQAKTLFDQGLSQMAYNVLINKLPNVAPDVVTFKVLDTDPEKGGGVGAFVIMRHGQTVYVPVVMAENQIKPLDILYYKDLNVFLPLNKEWLEELDKLSLEELGQGVKTPSTLSTDVDIRSAVIPPTTGRYSYASENDAVKQAARVFDEARNQVHEPKLAFLDFLEKAPNAVKLATVRLFEKRPILLKTAVWHYGKDALTKSLTLKKEADYGHKVPLKGGMLYVADKKTKPGEFKEIFGADAGVAYQGVAAKSYYAKDNRKGLKRSLSIERPSRMQEPKSPGVYRFFDAKAKPFIALVVGAPIDVFKREYSHNSSVYHRREKSPTRYVGITESGKWFDVKGVKLYGELVTADEASGSKFKKAFEGATGNPRSGSTGIFVKRDGDGYIFTSPVKIKSVTDPDKDDEKIVEVTDPTYDWSNPPSAKIVFDGKRVGRTPIYVAGTCTVHLDKNFIFVPCSGEMKREDLLAEPGHVLEWTVSQVKSAGAERVVVKHARYNGYTFGDSPRESFDFVPALKKLAVDAHISVEDADAALKLAHENGRFEFFTLDDNQYTGLATKLAGDDDKKKSSGSSDKKKSSSGGGDSGGGGDPAQAAMDAMGAGGMMAGPSPVDMAVAEQTQNIQGQILALQQQLTLLQSVQMRAQQIGGTGGMAGNPAAGAATMGGPMDPSMMGAGAPVGMAPMESGGAVPGAQVPGSVAGGPPQQMPGMMQPGMQPPGGGSAVPGAPGGAPPQAAMGGMQPGMDPSMQGQQQMPSAAMTSDDGSIDTLMNQVNPQFMEQAGQLQDAGAFDAAALSSMAQSPQLKDLVSGYLPNLEKSLDNIGRVLLTLWMDESQIKGDIGAETYIALEDNLRTTFKGLGDLILKINQNTMVIRPPNAPVTQEM